MIGYVCKYTPVELLSALSADPVRVEPHVASFNEADAYMHPNVCSYAKAVLEDIDSHGYEGIVFTTCCDSIRRLHDTCKVLYPKKFVYLLDLPRKVDDASVMLFAHRIEDLLQKYRQFSGHEFNRPCLIDLLVSQHAKKKRQEGAGRRAADRPRVGVVGARYSAEISRILNDSGVDVSFDITCLGTQRTVGMSYERLEALDDHALIACYARALLEQIPCMRMDDIAARDAFLEQQAGQVDGIVYHTMKFCDIYSYEYAFVHSRFDIPVLKIETDATTQSSGQIRTRVEAFAETLKTARGIASAVSPVNRKPGEKMYVLGIDSGSTSTNAAVLDESRNLVASKVIRTGARATSSAERVVQEVLDEAGIAREDVALIVSTGYGRVSVNFADLDVTEISCHGKGAWYFNPEVRTILDIGGQDSKAIRLDDNGEVVDFAMNDKCAAGTGRFLEAMARTLEVGIEELGPLSQRSQHHVEISSMCTVFAESEVISLIANDTDKADIAHGVHEAIAGKACSLLRRVKPEPVYMMTGGVAKNPGVVEAVEAALGESLYICDEPEIVGAVGAALIGLESLEGAQG
ncbi:MAG: acyl-CoA dehydratase activase [Coriobacteriales bacterium]